MEIEESWRKFLEQEGEHPYMKDLKNFLLEEKKSGYEICPPLHLIFEAFKYTPYEQVKVVIIGQDPYHGKGQAHGLSFSVPETVRIPPSLKNIFLEINRDLGLPIPSQGNLIPWAKQGVLLLNAILTVRASSPQSHQKKGWEIFTDAVIDALIQREDPVIFLLWGRFAQEKVEKIKGAHVVLKAAHPSPYSVSKFFGCRHFSKTNEILERWGKAPIDWSIVEEK